VQKFCKGRQKDPGRASTLTRHNPGATPQSIDYPISEPVLTSYSPFSLDAPPVRLFLLAAGLVLASCECSDSAITEPPSDPTPAPAYNRGFYLDMALDSAGNPWLAYQDRDHTALFVAQGSGDPIAFSHQSVDGKGEVQGGLLVGNFDAGYYASIALDSGDIPHVAHWDKDDGRLRYGTDSGEGWMLETVDTGSVGQFTSIGIRQGAPVIAYYDYGAGSLKVAHKSEGQWSTETVDAGDGSTSSATGKYADLLVGANGTIHVAYYDEVLGELRVASGTPGNWSISTWYSSESGKAGAWPNLSEHGGSLYASFQDLGANALMFGRWTGSQLDATVVHSGEFIGADSATAWIGDSPTIMYHDGVNNDAILAVNTGSGWTHSTHMGDGAHGFHNSLETGPTGQLNWAGFNHSTTDIEFQRFSPQ